MMSLEAIDAIVDEQTRKSRREKREPWFCPLNWGEMTAEQRSERMRRIPFLGKYLNKQWKQSTRQNGPGITFGTPDRGLVLVDKSGFGADDEPALTADRFRDEWVRPGYGYGIIEEGQFQVVIAEYQERI